MSQLSKGDALDLYVQECLVKEEETTCRMIGNKMISQELCYFTTDQAIKEYQSLVKSNPLLPSISTLEEFESFLLNRLGRKKLQNVLVHHNHGRLRCRGFITGYRRKAICRELYKKQPLDLSKTEAAILGIPFSAVSQCMLYPTLSSSTIMDHPSPSLS